jgi:NADH dehydrogenase
MASSSLTSPARHRVVIVGCGFGGLFAVKALRGADLDVTVIDRNNHHLFQPLLYQMATGILSEGDIAPPIRDILRRHRNTRVLLGDVLEIDPGARELAVDTLGHRSTVGYDSLIVATGSSQSYFGNDEFARHAPGMKTIDNALELRGRIFGAFELAEREEDPEARRRWMTFVVVGAGPTGVEMAGQIAELSHRSLRRNFRSIDPSNARVILLDGESKALAAYPPRLQRNAIKDLERLGVEVRLGTLVTGVDARGIDTNSDDPALSRIEAGTKVWAAGVEASSLGKTVAKATGAPMDRAGRIQLEADCTVPGHPEIFVIGDLMAGGFPGVAEVAMQSGVHAARTIRRRIHGDNEPRPFRYRDLGTMAAVSRFRAVGTIGPIQLWGFVGWVAWLFIHLLFLTGFKNRAAVLANWTIAFVGRGRTQRAITAQQVFGRRALERRAAAAETPALAAAAETPAPAAAAEAPAPAAAAETPAPAATDDRRTRAATAGTRSPSPPQRAR